VSDLWPGGRHCGADAVCIRPHCRTGSRSSSSSEKTPPIFDDLQIADLVSVKGRRLKDLNEDRIKAWKIYDYDPEQDRTKSDWVEREYPERQVQKIDESIQCPPRFRRLRTDSR